MIGKQHEHSIIQGKLYPANGTRKPLPRPRLDSSNDVLDGIFPVVVVAAPAGYGKSTLMARWHARLLEREVSCAWLSLDEDDNDATRFLSHLITALQKAGAHIGKNAAEDVIADLASGSRSLLEAIAGDLAQVQHRIVLFLDDLQLIERPEVREIIDWLINYSPRSLQYVIGTRQDPGLRLSGLRVRSQLLELGAEQLQFDAREAAQFYKNRLGRDLPVPDLQTLLTKTEGWSSRRWCSPGRANRPRSSASSRAQIPAWLTICATWCCHRWTNELETSCSGSRCSIASAHRSLEPSPMPTTPKRPCWACARATSF
jgi:LuxR family maltose regulon positive regulatory protein